MFFFHRSARPLFVTSTIFSAMVTRQFWLSYIERQATLNAEQWRKEQESAFREEVNEKVSIFPRFPR